MVVGAASCARGVSRGGGGGWVRIIERASGSSRERFVCCSCHSSMQPLPSRTARVVLRARIITAQDFKFFIFFLRRGSFTLPCSGFVWTPNCSSRAVRCSTCRYIDRWRVLAVFGWRCRFIPNKNSLEFVARITNLLLLVSVKLGVYHMYEEGHVACGG